MRGPRIEYFIILLLFSMSSHLSALPVNGLGEGLDLNVQFRLSGQYDDHGLEKTAGAEDPKPTFALDMNNVNLNLNGSINKEVSYSLSYQLLQSNIDWFYVERKFGSLFEVRAGIDRINTAGFDHKNVAYNHFSPSAFLGHLPLNTRAPSLELKIHPVESTYASVQITDDVLSAGNAGRNSLRFNETNKQPVFIFELGAEIWGLKPLLQFAEYDFRHSVHTAFGVAIDIGSFDAYIDYIVDKRAFRSEAVASGELSDEHSSKVVHVSYDFSGYVAFAKFSEYEVSQGGVDVKGNEFDVDAYAFSDNAQKLSVGTTVRHQKRALESYYYVESTTADFTTESNIQIQSKSTLKYVVGIMGSI